MLERIRNEPALASALIATLLGLAASFGLDLSVEQTTALNAVTVAVLAFAFVRPKVVPVRKLDPDLLSAKLRPDPAPNQD